MSLVNKMIHYLQPTLTTVYCTVSWVSKEFQRVYYKMKLECVEHFMESWIKWVHARNTIIYNDNYYVHKQERCA